jgi:lysophospholipase L1-like esterase
MTRQQLSQYFLQKIRTLTSAQGLRDALNAAVDFCISQGGGTGGGTPANLAAVATSGDYADLTGKPAIPADLTTALATERARIDAILAALTPKPPTASVVNDAADTLAWTDTPGKTWQDAEYTTDAGATWQPATANPQPIGDVVLAADVTAVRYRAVYPLPASPPLFAGAAFTLYVAPVGPAEQVVAWGGTSGSPTLNAETGDISFAGAGAVYSDLILNNTPGSYLQWQFPPTLAECQYLNIGFDTTKALTDVSFGPAGYLDESGQFFLKGATTTTYPDFYAPGRYGRLAVAANGVDITLSRSDNGTDFTLAGTVPAYAGYYTADETPLVIRLYANLASKLLKVKAYGLVKGLYQVVVDGNSLPAGTNSSTGPVGTPTTFGGMDFPAQLKRLLPANMHLLANFGISGQTTTQMSSDAAAQIDVRAGNYYRQDILVACEITNDFCNAGTSKEQAFENFKQYCLARKAAGWKVIALNVLERTTNLNGRTLAEVADMVAYVNARLAAEYAGFADALVDVHALNLQNTAGWDGTHPSDAGYALVAQAAEVAALSLIAA